MTATRRKASVQKSLGQKAAGRTAARGKGSGRNGSDGATSGRRDGLLAGWGLIGWGLIGWAAIAAAAVFLAWSGWTVWHDGPGARSGPERARDVVLRSAREQVAALNSMDPARVDAGLRAWRDASTGALHDQLARDEPLNRTKIGQSRTAAAATVTAAAVTSLDVREGKAKVIASVQVKLALRGGVPTLQRKRFEAGTVRTPSGWRLESLTAIPVGAR